MTEQEATMLIALVQRDMPHVKATIMSGGQGRRNNQNSNTKNVLLTIYPGRRNSERSLQIGSLDDWDSVRMAWQQLT